MISKNVKTPPCAKAQRLFCTSIPYYAFLRTPNAKFYRKALCRSAGCNCAPKCDILMQRPFVSGFIRRTEQKTKHCSYFYQVILQ